MNWLSILVVFLGSGLGGVGRFVVGRVVQSHLPVPTLFPWGTFVVNVVGCFLIGLFYGLFDKYVPASGPSQHLRMLLTVGFCGGFTTFSTFINENYLLFQSSNLPMVLLYVALSVLVGFALLYLGHAIA